MFLIVSFSSFNPSSVFHAVNHANGRTGSSQAYAFESSDLFSLFIAGMLVQRG
jgi:hypothetical protein